MTMHRHVRTAIILSILSAVGIAAPMDVQAVPLSPNALTIVVNSSLADAPDVNPGDEICETAPGNGICTLRAAVMEANSTPGQDEIQIPAGTFALSRSGYDDTALNGDLDILDDLVLSGVSYDDTFIDGNGNVTQGRVFHIHSGVTAIISNLRIRGGNGLFNTQEETGGGILNQGNLTLRAVSVRNNSAYKHAGITNEGSLLLQRSFVTDNDPGPEGAGGIGNTGTLEVLESRISSNLAGEWGGIYSNGVLTVTRSTISANISDEKGGVYAIGSVWIEDSTISNNNGGGIHVTGADVTVQNSTISGNFTNGTGGGMYIAVDPGQQVNLFNVTISNNIADSDNAGGGSGGGIYVYTGSVRIANSILANNVLERGAVDQADDCNATIESLGYNLIESTNGCTITGVLTGNKTAQDPQLGGLAQNGGFTLTHALLPGSPAIDSGNPSGCGNALGERLPFDQREHLRHFDGGLGTARCDMGAFEYLSPSSRTYLPVAIR